MTKILVAEDDLDIARLIQFQLKLNGYEVTAVGDGAEAMKRARRDQPDLMLVDWMMPVMDGLQVITALKADPELKRIPVILMTARAQEHDVQAGLAAGATAYLVKPFQLEQLVQAIQEALHEAS